MRKTLTPAERLIVDADFKPGGAQSLHPTSGRQWVRGKVLELADSLNGTGVYLKVNSALRAVGYDLISEIRSRGLRVFADLKLIDIGETLSTDGALLKEAKPELLTVMCVSGLTAMRALKAELPDTEVLGVTVLTSLREADTQEIFGCNVDDAVVKLAIQGAVAGIDGFICSPKEVGLIRKLVHGADVMSINTPAIRPKWAFVLGDDQNPDRSMTPAEAIQAGADRIVVGRPITKPPEDVSSRDSVMRTIEEITLALA